MNSPAPQDPNPPLFLLRDRAIGIIATATLLALLYLGRDVLVPITLAVILSLAVSPLVYALRRLGAGQTLSVLVAVLGLALLVAAVTAVLGFQVVRITANLPQYEATIGHKLDTLNDLAIGKLNALRVQTPKLAAEEATPMPAGNATGLPRSNPTFRSLGTPAAAEHESPVPVQVLSPPTGNLNVLHNVLGSIWVPLQTAGIVIVVLVFLLLEHEAVRDRFIRIAGGSDIRGTTIAINDAGERLSRFFVSQFMVNLGVACAVWLGLVAVGLPHPLLWGAMAGVLRFVPYIGVWVAALLAGLLAAAVDPGWALAGLTLALFVIVEVIAGQLIEPQLYGHTTGLSPLSVVVAAIFWSWLWGPVGLILSTPLTLCLLVAGRHIKALSVLDVLLGDSQALTMPQRFYQRALSADSQELIASARQFLKRNSFAAYCDLVLMPALYLARLDLSTGAITPEQQARVRSAVLSVIGAIGGNQYKPKRRPAKQSVLDSSGVGRELRLQREQVSGPFQGPLSVPPGSIMLCVGLGTQADELATELLVRILRDQKTDARHLSVEDLARPMPPDASEESVSAVYLVSAFPSDERDTADGVAQTLRRRFPKACLVTVFLPGMLLQPGSAIDSLPSADRAATSFGHAMQICVNMQQRKDQAGVAAGKTSVPDKSV